MNRLVLGGNASYWYAIRKSIAFRCNGVVKSIAIRLLRILMEVRISRKTITKIKGDGAKKTNRKLYRKTK